MVQHQARLIPNPAASIDGTATEKRLFHAFRVATEAGVALHVGNVSSFWADLAPRFAHHNYVVKHAVVALGAAYRCFKTAKEVPKSAMISRYTSMDGHSFDTLEVFTMSHYTMAIKKLHNLIASESSDCAIVAIVCCLVFICIENLRFNHHGAITHLKNGIRIINSSIHVKALFRSGATSSHATTDRPVSALVSNEELRGIIGYFRHLEICERLFTYDVPLVLAPLLRSVSRYDTGGTLPSEFQSLADAHKVRLDLTNDVMARDWEVRDHRGDAQFWSLPPVQVEHHCLSSRAQKISDLYEAFLASPKAPKPGTRERASSYLDMLQIKCMQSVIGMMPLLDSDQRLPNLPGILLLETIHYAERLHATRKAFTDKSDSPLDFTVEIGVVAPLYYAYVYATEPEHKAIILKLLSECTAREGPWDGKILVMLIELSSGPVVKVDALRKWGGSLDCRGMFPPNITEW